MSVIEELRSITRLTKKENGLNESISANFTKEEQLKLYKIAQSLLEDEIVHAMTLLTIENQFKNDIND